MSGSASAARTVQTRYHVSGQMGAWLKEQAGFLARKSWLSLPLPSGEELFDEVPCTQHPKKKPSSWGEAPTLRCGVASQKSTTPNKASWKFRVLPVSPVSRFTSKTKDVRNKWTLVAFRQYFDLHTLSPVSPVFQNACIHSRLVSFLFDKYSENSRELLRNTKNTEWLNTVCAVIYF